MKRCHFSTQSASNLPVCPSDVRVASASCENPKGSRARTLGRSRVIHAHPVFRGNTKSSPVCSSRGGRCFVTLSLRVPAFLSACVPAPAAGVLFLDSGGAKRALGRERGHQGVFLPRSADPLQRGPLETEERAAQGGETECAYIHAAASFLPLLYVVAFSVSSFSARVGRNFGRCVVFSVGGKGERTLKH